ncbi:Ribonuclease Oy, partial [Schistosoma japonicum]
ANNIVDCSSRIQKSRLDAYLFSLTWPPTFCSSYNVTLPLNFTDFHHPWTLWLLQVVIIVLEDSFNHLLSYKLIILFNRPIILPNITVNCTGTEKFNISLLQGLRPKLDVEWPSLRNLSRTESLWKHEFEKHGLCAVEDPKILNQVGYFNTSLQLRAKTDLLKDSNINAKYVTEYTYRNALCLLLFCRKLYFKEVLKKK